MKREEIQAKLNSLYEIKMMRLSNNLVCIYPLRAAECVAEVVRKTDMSDMWLRRAWIFAALFVAAPQKFAGKYIPSVLTDALKRATGVSSSCISHFANPLALYFATYDDFAEKATEIVNLLLNTIKDR